MGTCAATNQDGSSCSNNAMEGSDFCHVHRESSGATTAVRPEDERGFWAMLAGALTVILVTHFLLQFVLGV